MQLVTPSEVAIAVRMLMAIWITIFQVSFFIIFYFLGTDYTDFLDYSDSWWEILESALSPSPVVPLPSALVNHTRFVFNEFVKIATTRKASFSAHFEVFIDDRRLPSFKTSCGLLWWPPWGTKGCSFDCRCKDTKIFGIRQILACDKERFSAKHFRFETSLKYKLYVL